MTSYLTATDDGPVRTLTISNPGKLNAIPADGWPVLAEALEAFETSDRRALVITGADGEFCAGADMDRRHPEGPSAADNAARMRTVNRAALALHRTTKPTIAAVDGVAVGAGMNLAIGCDIVLATPRARFGEVFVKRGLTLDFGGTWLLPRVVGLNRARELALTGRVIGAEEAHAIGIVTHIVPEDDLAARARELAIELAEGAPLAQSFIKRGLDRSSTMSFEQALAFEEQAQAVLLATEDLVEGATAFMEKRPPRFTGR
jgi:2-(1,2-epoxy-1,2-dihydrophenyl)acetyl-CoA isomerase